MKMDFRSYVYLLALNSLTRIHRTSWGCCNCRQIFECMLKSLRALVFYGNCHSLAYNKYLVSAPMHFLGQSSDPQLHKSPSRMPAEP